MGKSDNRKTRINHDKLDIKDIDGVQPFSDT